jgi:hypothetical protein
MRFSTSLIAAVSVTLLGINSAEGYGILGKTLASVFLVLFRVYLASCFLTNVFFNS